MTYHQPIIDVEFLNLVEEIDLSSGWGIWSVIVTFEDETQAEGTLQGDGVSSWAEETFEGSDE